MTRDEQVKLALALLKPKVTDRDQCRQRIEEALNVITETETEMGKTKDFYASKETKLKVKAHRRALDRVRTTYNALPDAVKFSTLDVQKHVADCDAILKLPSEQQDDRAWKQQVAAAGALDLLQSCGRKASVTRHGQWDRLAAILYGNRHANMFPYIWQLAPER